MADFVPQKKSLPQVWPKVWSGPLPKNTHGLHNKFQWHAAKSTFGMKAAMPKSQSFTLRRSTEEANLIEKHGDKPSTARNQRWKNAQLEFALQKSGIFKQMWKKTQIIWTYFEIYWIFLNHCIALYGSLKIDLHGKFQVLVCHIFRWNQIWEDMDLRETKHREP